MRVTFDPGKRARTLSERGLDFADAPLVFDGPHRTYVDDRQDYGEERLLTIGYLDGRMVFVAWTERDGAMRVISMRKANAREIRDNEARLRPRRGG